MIVRPEKYGWGKRARRHLSGVASVLLLMSAIGLLAAVTPIFGNRGLIVRSGSMEPAIGVGDLVVVRPRRDGNYRVGEAIAFASNIKKDMVVTHRIKEVSKTEEGETVYVTKGDANKQADTEKVKLEQVLGRQLLVIPKMGQVLAFGKTKGGYLLFIVVPALLVIAGEGRVIVGEMAKNRRVKKKIQAVVRPMQNKRQIASEAKGGRLFVKPIAVERVFSTKRKIKLVPVDSLTGRLGLLIVGLLIMTPSTWALYADSEVSTGNVLQAAACGDVPSVPSLIYPPDGLVAGPGSAWVVNPYMDWSNSFSSCSGGDLKYKYQSAHDIDFNQVAYTSSWLVDSMIPAPNTPSGSYYWRVRAGDGGGESAWSNVRLLVVDN